MAAVADLSADREAKIARRWCNEVDLAGKREKDWRDDAKKIITKYRGADKRKNSFNILWANTEILRPALYSSPPKPDVRRRFRDDDPVGKAISEILERGLMVVIDHQGSDQAFRADTLDSLLCGRGISRIRYEPKISARPKESEESEDTHEDTDPDVDEELEDEEVYIEHVDWQDYRQGDGRQWEEVFWVAFRHMLTKDDTEDQFGPEAAAEVKFTPPENTTDDDPKRLGDQMAEIEKVAEFWEIWDRTSQRVFFLNLEAKKRFYPLATPDGEAPLEFEGFFPCARPALIIENTGSLIPIPIYRLYEEQAKELERITMRINKIVDAMKLRAVYDSSLNELSDLMKGEDNDMVPAARASAWRDNGGLDKAISWMPIGPAAQVLEQLMKSRDSCKQIIYEITGISDIVRGASVASETATAQQIKANYASVRLKRMQGEIQRYVRDTLRLVSEVFSTKFERETLAKMTDLNFPTAEQKQMMQQQLALQAHQAPPPGGAPGATPPPPPPPGVQAMLAMPTWEDIMKVMRDQCLRDFRVDVETDSTIAATIESDMDGLTKIMAGLGQTMQILAPMVQSKALPVDAAKEIVLAIVRRAKLGSAVEDAIEKMQAPQPPPQPPDPSLQVAQINAQSEEKIEQMRIQSQQARSAAESQASLTEAQGKAQVEQMAAEKEAAMKAQIDAMQKQHEQELEAAKMQAENLRKATELETQRQITDADNATKIEIARIQFENQQKLQAQQQAHEQTMARLNASLTPESSDAGEESDETPTAAEFKEEEADSTPVDKHLEAMNQLIPLMTQVAFHMSKPKRVVRDENGKIAGIE